MRGEHAAKIAGKFHQSPNDIDTREEIGMTGCESV